MSMVIGFWFSFFYLLTFLLVVFRSINGQVDKGKLNSIPKNFVPVLTGCLKLMGLLAPKITVEFLEQFKCTRGTKETR